MFTFKPSFYILTIKIVTFHYDILSIILRHVLKESLVNFRTQNGVIVKMA